MKLRNSWMSLMVMAALVALAGSANGAWVDDFNDYTGPGVALDDTNSAPWDVVWTNLRTNDDGSGGYCVRSSNNARGNMRRASDAGDTTLQFDFQLQGFTGGSFSVMMSQDGAFHPDYGITMPAFIGFEADARDSGGQFDTLRFTARNSDWGLVSSWDLKGAGLGNNVWYNAKIFLDGGTVTYAYKLATDTIWTESTGNAAPTSFAFNYVTVESYEGSAGQGGLVDNVGSVPEPTTLALLAAGGLLAIRRKK